MKARLDRLLRVGGGIRFHWSDSRACDLSLRVLRQECPCAHCVHEVTGVKILDPDSVAVGIDLRDMQPVGGYAYRLLFDDGHDTGIYSLDFLRSLCQRQEGAPS